MREGHISLAHATIWQMSDGAMSHALFSSGGSTKGAVFTPTGPGPRGGKTSFSHTPALGQAKIKIGF